MKVDMPLNKETKPSKAQVYIKQHAVKALIFMNKIW